MKRLFSRHPFLWSLGVLGAFCALILLLCRLFPPFAEFFSTTVGAAARLFLAYLTAPLPFSLFEISIAAFVLYLLFLLIFLPILLVRRRKKLSLPKKASRFFLAVPVTLLCVFILFVFTFAPSYFRHSTARHMKLDTERVGEEEVFFALQSLSDVIGKVAPQLEKNENGESVPTASLSEIKRAVVKAADAFGEKNDFYQEHGAAAKSFLSSPVMTYTHLAGVYGFFTGEANVNTNYPHFVVTASIAHETCHARGIAPENECNFLAAVILLESEDPYLVYCGAVSLMDDLVSVCKKLDRQRTLDILAETDPVRQKDMEAYSRFFDPYRESRVSEVSDSANSAYLKAMGQKEGTVSYSRVIRLTSAYFQQRNS